MIELGLQRIRHLLATTPLPWRAIHIAGTNGKGSICAYISGMLDVYNNSTLRQRSKQAPIRHGRFTSPHLVDRWDCITLDQQTVSASVFREAERKVHARNEKEAIGASEFELLTATAFEIFSLEGMDVAVIETGMGGRLDATNIIGDTANLPTDTNTNTPSFRPPPLVTAFSSIGMDHQEFLGNTLEAITAEKAGILKRGVPVAYDWSNPPAINKIIAHMAAEKHCPPPSWAPNNNNDSTETDQYSLQTHAQNLNIPSSLNNLPSHTLSNLAVAYQATTLALRGLNRLPPNPTPNHQDLQDLERAMLHVPQTTQPFPGRQQNISLAQISPRTEPALLDGAHNLQSAQALSQTVAQLRRTTLHPRVTWVLAASSTKDVRELLSPLLQNGDAVFGVEFGPVDGMPWVRPRAAGELVDVAREVVAEPGSLYGEACGTDVRGALQKASERADGGPLVIAGSLYLVGDVLRLLRGTDSG